MRTAKYEPAFSRAPSRPPVFPARTAAPSPENRVADSHPAPLPLPESEGVLLPRCEVGTWIEIEGSVVKRDHSRRVRTVDFLTLPYPAAVETLPGFRAAGFAAGGERLRPDPATGRIAVPADTPFVLVIAADEEPAGRLTERDAADYARALRIPTKTAADVAALAESLGTVSASVLAAVAAVAEAEEMLADRMTGMLDGAFSPVCEPGRWVPGEGSRPEREEDPSGRTARTAGFLSFRYEALVEVAGGFRVTGLREDGGLAGQWTGTFRVPADTSVCFTVQRTGEGEGDPLAPAEAARAVRIFTRPAVEIRALNERVARVEEELRRLLRIPS